jgi:hypothetical protein
MLAVLAAVRCGSSSPSAPTPPANSPSISFVTSNPQTGGDVVTTQVRPLSMAFSVVWPVAIPGARVQIRLLDASGRVCGYAFSQPQDLPAATAVTFINPSAVFVFSDTSFNVGCALPATITSVQVTLLTLIPDAANAYLTRTEYHDQVFVLPYALREYPRPPAGAPPVAPTIASLTWKNGSMGCGSCDPISREPVDVICVATATDGAEATATISIAWDGGPTDTLSRTFPAGATSAPGGVTFKYGSGAVGSPPRGTAECRVVNVRGESTSSTIRIPG